MRFSFFGPGSSYRFSVVGYFALKCQSSPLPVFLDVPGCPVFDRRREFISSSGVSNKSSPCQGRKEIPAKRAVSKWISFPSQRFCARPSEASHNRLPNLLPDQAALHPEEGSVFRQIARELKVDLKTVRKWARRENFSKGSAFQTRKQTRFLQGEIIRLLTK